MTHPEIQLTACIHRGVIRERSSATPLLNNNHHSADPAKTPATIKPALE